MCDVALLPLIEVMRKSNVTIGSLENIFGSKDISEQYKKFVWLGL